MPASPREATDRALLEITEVRISPQSAKGLLAFVSVTFNDCFVVRGLKIIEGMDGRFVAMPARKKKDDTFQDIAHPICREFRAYLERVVLEEYRNKIEGRDGSSPHPPARAEGDAEFW